MKAESMDQKTKTMIKNRLKSSVELRGTAESGENSLWVCHYQWKPFTLHTVF